MDLSALPMATKWVEWGLRRDDMGLLRTPQGDPFSAEVTAYDTCFVLGQEPDYAECPTGYLPQKIREYYLDWGADTLVAAMAGWKRGRERSLRDYRKMPKEQSVAAFLRSVKTGTAPAPASEPVVIDIPEPSFVAQARKAAGEDGPTVYVERDPDKVIFSQSVIARLDRETREMLKRLLSPMQYSGAYGYQVFRHLRCQSRGLTSEETVLTKRLRREVGKAPASHRQPVKAAEL